MGGACSTNEGRRGTRIGYWWENSELMRPVGRQNIGGWIILRWILERYDGGGVNCISLVLDMDKWSGFQPQSGCNVNGVQDTVKHNISL
jgi:hypothetical protein